MKTPNLQPTLIGPTVLVRPVLPEDWEGMFAAAADPELWADHPASDRYLEPVFRTYFDEALASNSAFSFVNRASGTIIGSSRYHGYDPQAGEIEIGWTFLSRAYWGGATNREIKTLMIAHAFTFVDTVIFYVGETNTRSRRAMEKIGGVLRPGLVTRDHGGVRFPYVIYEIRKE